MQSAAVNLAVVPLQLRFAALEPLLFPIGRSANILRGALGSALRAISADAYARYFDPSGSGSGPSGFAKPPRPFVLRVSHLDGRRIAEGEVFEFRMNLFDGKPEAIECFRRAVTLMFNLGLGTGRGRARLDAFDAPTPLHLSLSAGAAGLNAVRVRFLTPTVLDGLEFGVLFARLRDRISNLRLFYGDGALELDFRAMGERAANVKLISSDVKLVRTERTSRETGQTHPLGGFTGQAGYEGNLAEFLPFLEAGFWTGVGKHTVWGNGQIQTEVTSPVNLRRAPGA